jgi:hypothetical protein
MSISTVANMSAIRVAHVVGNSGATTSGKGSRPGSSGDRRPALAVEEFRPPSGSGADDALHLSEGYHLGGEIVVEISP